MSRFAHHRTTFLSIIFAARVLVVAASPAAAQAPGVRAGCSVDPDQFFVGSHYETGPLVERLHLKPNVEFGFGDDITTTALNFEFVYKIPVSGPWNLYAGAGPAVNFYSFNDDTFTEGGVNFLIGAEATQGLSFELKLGAGDSPDLKFGVGYSWR